MQYLWLRKSPHATRAPVALNLEPTNRCNLRCRFCSYEEGRPTGDMDWNFYESTVDQAARIGVMSINHFLSGEPLLHPRIVDMVRYAAQRGLYTYMHTNATLLTPDLSAALIQAGLQAISFSFDGEDKAVYEANRVGARYEKTLDNILAFLHEKKRIGSHAPFTRIQLIRDQSQLGQERVEQGVDPEFRKLFHGLPLDGFYEIPPFNQRGEKSDLHLPERKQYFPCFHLWNGLAVTWNGKVAGCCADLNARFLIGDLNTQSILDVWHSKAMRSMRQMLIQERYKEVPLCAECSKLWIYDAEELRLPGFLKAAFKNMIT